MLWSFDNQANKISTASEVAAAAVLLEEEAAGMCTDPSQSVSPPHISAYFPMGISFLPLFLDPLAHP